MNRLIVSILNINELQARRSGRGEEVSDGLILFAFSQLAGSRNDHCVNRLLLDVSARTEGKGPAQLVCVCVFKLYDFQVLGFLCKKTLFRGNQ
ncbi:hypothetical protein NC653_001889 [Populus alba x Populus x berolinensis]|uniref:Uncharacterized protein n=1 Tax=Populus alba x Populus x berolinensis TaxID=444605 RepID=A0AAD6RM95_9ROSI|nr:hypothetical protein NC653_001889 [Populus alba x Populus x berolinensis]